MDYTQQLLMSPTPKADYQFSTPNSQYSPVPLPDFSVFEKGLAQKNHNQYTSQKKKKLFVPLSPAKNYSKSKFTQKSDLYSPITKIITFDENFKAHRSLYSSPLTKMDCNSNHITPIKKMCSRITERSESLLSNDDDMMCTIGATMNKFEQEFEIISLLGSGSFGNVYKVHSKIDNMLYAVKKSKQEFKGYNDRDFKLKEVQKSMMITKSTLSNLNDYCITFYEAWEESGFLFIKTELCDYGNLQSFLEKCQNAGIEIEEDDLWNIFLDMCLAVKHVHDSGFIHLDVKPTNFLVTDNKLIKLGDFGQAIQSGNTNDIVIEGDCVYLAPEMLDCDRGFAISNKCDIFSLGASFLEIAGDIELPLNGPMWQKLRQGDITFSPDSQRSKDLEHLINWMMEPRPEDRPSIDEVLNINKFRELICRKMIDVEIKTSFHSAGKRTASTERKPIETLIISPNVKQPCEDIEEEKLNYGSTAAKTGRKITFEDIWSSNRQANRFSESVPFIFDQQMTKASINFHEDGQRAIPSKFNQHAYAQRNKSQRQLFQEEDEAMEPVMEVTEPEGFFTPKPTNLLDVRAFSSADNFMRM